MTTDVSPDNNPTFYHETARSWREDWVESLTKERSLYRTLSLGLFTLLSLSLLGLTVLVTRERVEPFLAVMDKRTGEVTTPVRLNEQTKVANWAMVRHFVTRYISDREAYHFSNLNEPYQTVLAMSAQGVKAQVNQAIRPELNSQSPIKTLGQQRYRTVTIHSIAKLAKDNLLDVRFSTHTINSETNHEEETRAWRVTLKWELSHRQRSLSEWDMNPLGFTVTFYDKQPVIA